MTTTNRPAAGPGGPRPAAPPLDRRLAVAPMMAWTDRHCRYLHRLLAPRTLLYTEMVTTGALLFGDAARHLAFHPAEHPLALQLGGSEPEALARAAALGAEAGYDEINLNCGCPSPRVQRGSFGACLMAEPDLVAECVAAMREAVPVPVTVKCRIGIDDSLELPFLARFVERVAAAGCTVFIVHARKAWLKGLSPKENREVPPLRYPVVHALSAAFPDLAVVLNGGVREPRTVTAELARVAGVMLGRVAYESPYALRAFEAAAFGQASGLQREAVIAAMTAYADTAMAAGTPLRTLIRPLLGLMNGLPGASAWRRRLSTLEPGDGPEVIKKAAALVRHDTALAA